MKHRARVLDGQLHSVSPAAIIISVPISEALASIVRGSNAGPSMIIVPERIDSGLGATGRKGALNHVFLKQRVYDDRKARHPRHTLGRTTNAFREKRSLARKSMKQRKAARITQAQAHARGEAALRRAKADRRAARAGQFGGLRRF